MFPRRLFAATLATFVLAVGGPAAASVVLETSVPELARAADVVARGKVGSTETRVSSDGRRIFTVVRLEVSEAWKGAPARTVEVQVPGGSHGEIAQKVHGAPTFREGEEVIVFLRDPARAANATSSRSVPLRVLSLAQGKLTVVRNADGVELAVPELDGLELVRPQAGGALVPVEKKAVPVPVRDLKKQVEASLP